MSFKIAREWSLPWIDYGHDLGLSGPMNINDCGVNITSWQYYVYMLTFSFQEMVL